MAFLMTAAFATSGVYRFELAGLSPLQLVLMGTALELSVFFFEIPTGIVADLYSRRLSMLVGYTLIGAGVFLEGALPLFLTILLAQVLWGVGYTFTSGAIDAWLADEIGEERLSPTYLRATQFSRSPPSRASSPARHLASIRLNIPFLVCGAGHTLAGPLSLLCPARNQLSRQRHEVNATPGNPWPTHSWPAAWTSFAANHC